MPGSSIEDSSPISMLLLQHKLKRKSVKECFIYNISLFCLVSVSETPGAFNIEFSTNTHGLTSLTIFGDLTSSSLAESTTPQLSPLVNDNARPVYKKCYFGSLSQNELS